jgi:UDP-N-acetylmuramoyl-tripeptide--D-alanyl-D-alanine ligase
VIEMGANHPGEIARLCEIASPTHGLVTSIGKAHLEGFGTMEALARTKKELYDSVAESGTAFVPTDDELCVAAASSVTEKLGYGFNAVPGHWNGAFVHGENLRFDTTGAACFTVGGTDICLGTPGRPAAMAALAALAIAGHFDIDPSVCKDTISAWRGGSGRMSIMRMGGMTVIDDTYNANPPSMRAALETLSHLSAARHVAILGDMYELGSYSEAEHERLGQSIGTYDVDHAIFVGTLSAMAAESARNSGVLTSYFPDYESLESELSKLLKSGDAILVKASRGMKLERVIDYIRNTTA